MSDAAVLSVERLGVRYGRQEVLEEISLGVRRGAVYAVALYEAPGGRPLATLMPPGAGGFVDADFLDDGRIALVESLATTRLRLFSPDGVETSALTISETKGAVRLAGEPLAGLLSVALQSASVHFAEDMLVVDLRAGRVTRILEGLSPIGATAAFWGPMTRLVPGSPATRLFLDDRGALVEVDPLSGERREVLPIRRPN